MIECAQAQGYPGPEKKCEHQRSFRDNEMWGRKKTRQRRRKFPALRRKSGRILYTPARASLRRVHCQKNVYNPTGFVASGSRHLRPHLILKSRKALKRMAGRGPILLSAARPLAQSPEQWWEACRDMHCENHTAEELKTRISALIGQVCESHRHLPARVGEGWGSVRWCC